MPHRFEELDLTVYDSEGTAISAADAITMSETAAAAGDYTRTFDRLHDLATSAVEHGLPGVALDILALLSDLVPTAQLTSVQQAWLLNIEGLSLGATGQRSEAFNRFTQMLSMGKGLEDLSLISTAQQNLGAYYFGLDDHERALEYYRQSVQQKVEIADYRGALQVLINLAALEMDTGNLTTAEEHLKTAESLLSLAAGPEPHLYSTLYGTRGLIAIERGDHALAEKYFRRSLLYARRSGDLDVEVKCLYNIARTRSDQGDTKGALRWFRRAISRAEDLQVVGTAVDLHQSLAALLYSMGRRKEALDHLQTAQELAARTDDPLRAARLSADLAAITLASGDGVVAREMLSPLIAVFLEHRDSEWAVRALRTLFAASAQAGDTEKASEYLEQATSLLLPDSHEDRAKLLQYAATTYLESHIPSRYAVPYFERGLAELERAESLQEAVEPSNIAWYCVQAAARLRDLGGDDESSIPFFERGLQIYEQLGEEHMAFHTRNDFANAYTKLGRFEMAQSLYEQCLEVAKKLDDRVMALQATANLGEMLRRADSFDAAQSMYDQALELARALGDLGYEADVLANKATGLEDVGDLEEAEVAFKEARAITRTLGRSPDSLALEARSLAGLGNIEFRREHYRRAARLYLQAAELERKAGRLDKAVESLGAAFESYSALGDEAKTQTSAQEVVTLAQEIGAYEIAQRALVRGARHWLRRSEYEEAASLFAIAILIVIADPFLNIDSDSETWLHEVLQPVLALAMSVEEFKLTSRGEFYRQVIESAEQQHTDSSKLIRRLISLVHKNRLRRQWRRRFQRRAQKRVRARRFSRRRSDATSYSGRSRPTARDST